MVRSGEPQVAAVLSRQRHVDVWRDAVGDVHIRGGALGRLQWHTGGGLVDAVIFLKYAGNRCLSAILLYILMA